MSPQGVLATAALVLLAGCVAPAAETLDVASADAAASDPTVGRLVWEGRVLVSAAEGASHARDLTPIIEPAFKEGFTVDVVGEPTALRVELFWNATGVGSQFWIRGHSPHDPSGESHAVRDYNSEPSADAHLCVEVAPAEVGPGKWIFMGRPSDRTSFAGTFTVHVTSPGATLALFEEPHGHPTTDAIGVTGEAFEEGTFVPC